MKTSSKETLAIVALLALILLAAWLTYDMAIHCDGTMVRGIFWYECIP